jgi:hypothetical protein
VDCWRKITHRLKKMKEELESSAIFQECSRLDDEYKQIVQNSTGLGQDALREKKSVVAPTANPCAATNATRSSGGPKGSESALERLSPKQG